MLLMITIRVFPNCGTTVRWLKVEILDRLSCLRNIQSELELERVMIDISKEKLLAFKFTEKP